MSLVGTLAKVAVGAMIAKGISGAMKGGGAGAGGGLGGLLGEALGKAGGGGGLGDLLSQGRGQQQGGGGLGGLGEMLGGALSGQQGGGLGGLIESLGGAQQQGQSGGGLGDLLNSALAGKEQLANPTAEQQAEICLRAMLYAARSDGDIDAAEQEKITGQLGDISAEEAQFIRTEMAAPMNVDGFIASVPKDMEQQVYLMSLLAIDLDSQAEAQYLDKLGKGLNIDHATSNAIHQKLGVPALYS